VGGGEQVGAHHPLDHGGLEVLYIDILAGAGVENGLIQRPPVLADAFANGAHLLGISEVAGRLQHLAGVALGQRMQGAGIARAEGQAVALLQQHFGQGGADAAAGAGQPDTSAHANLRFSQAMTPPISGRCS
jgi:hypothetical protein